MTEVGKRYYNFILGALALQARLDVLLMEGTVFAHPVDDVKNDCFYSWRAFGSASSRAQFEGNFLKDST